MGSDIDMKFHQEVMEIVSYDISVRVVTQIVKSCHSFLVVGSPF